MTCGEVCPPPHDHHHGMAAPSTALERCVVPLPSCPASGCGWTDSHPTITGGWFGSWRQGPDQLMERWVLLLPPFPAKMEVAAPHATSLPPSEQIKYRGQEAIPRRYNISAPHPLAPSGKYN